MEELLKGRFGRRIFFGSAAVALVAVLAVRYFVLPTVAGITALSTGEILAAVLDALLISLIASVAIAAVVLWLKPPQISQAVVDVVEPRRIAETLVVARTGTDEWWYRGHSGRHFRAVTLPALAKESRRRNVSKKVVLQILDPTNRETCEYYARYRQQLRTATANRPWTEERVSLELNATIISTLAWRQYQPPLRISIALLDSVSLFRVDLSSHLVLITKEDPKEPALRCDKGTIFYDSYREDLRLTLEQARQLPLPAQCESLDRLTIAGVQKLLEELSLREQDLSDPRVQKMIELVNAAENPYA